MFPGGGRHMVEIAHAPAGVLRFQAFVKRNIAVSRVLAADGKRAIKINHALFREND